MRLNEVAAPYHGTLNPKLWSKDKELKRDVLEKLERIAMEFEEFLGVESLEIEDVIITGSNANFNWTEQSDVDLHLVVDMSEIEERCPELTDDFFLDKKTLWNEHHEVTIHNHPVELYVQDINEPHIASGVYSVSREKWLKEPEHDVPSYKGEDVQIKAEQMKREIDRLIDSIGDSEDVQRMKEKIRRYRKAGLSKGGEYSTENLVFKELRNSGYLEKLRDYGRQAKSDELSL